MSLSSPFIHRPVATTLLTAAIALGGAIAFLMLPVSPLPQVDFPTISVGASLPGASPETMASSVATPLERQFGRIAGVTEMTSTSTLGSTGITLQFDLNRNIDGAARDVQAAINAAQRVSAVQPAEQPDLAQGESVRRADHDPGADLRRLRPRAPVRRGLHDPHAEALADRGRRPGHRRRRLAPRRARGGQPDAVEQLRARPSGRRQRAEPAERQRAQGPDLGRRRPPRTSPSTTSCSRRRTTSR